MYTMIAYDWMNAELSRLVSAADSINTTKFGDDLCSMWFCSRVAFVIAYDSAGLPMIRLGGLADHAPKFTTATKTEWTAEEVEAAFMS